MFLTVKELSHLLKIKASTIYSWAAKGKIPVRKINGLVRFWSEDITEWLTACSSGAMKPVPLNFACAGQGSLDAVIARAKREVYTPRHGETRLVSGLMRKEERDGAL